MTYKRSEVFENYIKISRENGLIDDDIVITAEAMTQEEKYKDKEWKETVQMLYNVNMDKEDILDKAHPKSVIIAPSYDKVNGRVDNLKEVHDIMTGIATKPPNGSYTNHKYASAKDDLLKNLIRIGYEFDNKNIDDIRKLADSCSERFVKNAFAPLLLAGGVALIAGITAIINNTSPSDQGIIGNIERAVKWIGEAKEGVPQLSGQIAKLEQDLITLQSLAHDYMNLDPVDISSPNKFKEVAERQQNKFDVVKKYKKACQIMSQRLPKYIDLIKNFKTQETSWGDFADKLVDIYRYFDPDDVKEAALALETLQGSLIQSVKETAYFMSEAKQKESSLIAALKNEDNEERSVVAINDDEKDDINSPVQQIESVVASSNLKKKASDITNEEIQEEKRAVLGALLEVTENNPNQALLSTRMVRDACYLPKEDFDNASLELAKEGKITLHHHDAPYHLSQEDKDNLIYQPGGNDRDPVYYVGMALRK